MPTAICVIMPRSLQCQIIAVKYCVIYNFDILLDHLSIKNDPLPENMAQAFPEGSVIRVLFCNPATFLFCF